MAVGLATPSLHTACGTPPRIGDALVVGISQSGASPDLVEVVAEGNRQGATTVGITNTVDSALGAEADHVVDIGAGPELAIAATKTYTTQLLAIARLSLAWDEEALDLTVVADAMEEVLAAEDHIATIAAPFAYAEACAVLGRGFNYATAFEWALKMTEVNYLTAQPFSTADFEHGPMALIESGFPVLATVVDGALADDGMDLIGRVRAAGGRVVLVTGLDGADADAVIRIPELPEWLTPLVTIVAGQLFTYRLALAKGLDPDSPRGLRKVTLTN